MFEIKSGFLIASLYFVPGSSIGNNPGLEGYNRWAIPLALTPYNHCKPHKPFSYSFLLAT